MSLLKYIERLKRMDDLIRRKATGSVDEFAGKLGISRSQVSQDLLELRQLGAPIKYCNYRKTYYYENDVSLIFDFVKGGNKIRGGVEINQLAQIFIRDTYLMNHYV